MAGGRAGGGEEEEGGRRWEGRKGRGAERSGGHETRRAEPRGGWGPTPSAPLPRRPRDANPWVRGRPSRSGSQPSRALGAQTESGATEVGLQGRTANQGGRRRGAGEGVGAPFPPSPKSAPAGQAGPLPGRPGGWVVGKAFAKWGRPWGNRASSRCRPTFGNPSTSAAPARPPSPIPGNCARGSGGENRGGRLRTWGEPLPGRPTPPPPGPRARSGVRGWLRRGRLGARHPAPHGGALAPIWSVTCCRRPPARTPAGAGECGVAGERASGRRALSSLHPPRSHSSRTRPRAGARPPPAPVGSPGGKAGGAGPWDSRRGLCGALAVRERSGGRTFRGHGGEPP